MADTACMYYIETPQEVSNQSKRYYTCLLLYSTKTNTSCNTTDEIINAYRLVTNVPWVKP